MPYLNFFIRTSLFVLFLFQGNPVFAQANFYKFNFGTGFGTTVTFADTKKTAFNLAGHVNLDYYLTPYMSLGTELQKGRLEGGENNSKYLNKYFTVTMNGKLYLGEFLSQKDLSNFILNTIKGIYGGAGVGIMRNKVDIVNQHKKSFSRDVIFPFTGGINFYFKNHWGHSRVILNFSFQTVPSLEDGMDGDLSPYSNFNDIYNYFSTGIKYNFGPMGLYRKRY